MTGPTFTVIVPTCGRETLGAAVASVAAQLGDGDELLAVRDDSAAWGNVTRDSGIRRAAGSHLWFMDDDDVASPGALTAIRDAVAVEPDAVHIFRMQYPDGRVIWQEPAVRVGNVGTPMIVVPNQSGRVGNWSDVYEGDAAFLIDTLEIRGDQPVWHEDVVALIRPAG